MNSEVQLSLEEKEKEREQKLFGCWLWRRA